MVHVIAKMVIQPGQEEVFLEYAAELIEATRKENGCLRYDLHTGDEQGAFFFIEDWQDITALDAHMQSDHFTRIVPQMGEISAEEPRVEITSPVDSL